jgi:hypothetical protein
VFFISRFGDAGAGIIRGIECWISQWGCKIKARAQRRRAECGALPVIRLFMEAPGKRVNKITHRASSCHGRAGSVIGRPREMTWVEKWEKGASAK